MAPVFAIRASFSSTFPRKLGLLPHSTTIKTNSVTGGKPPLLSTLTRRKDHLCHAIPALITTLSPDLRIFIPLHVLIMGSLTLDSKACTKDVYLSTSPNSQVKDFV